MCTPYGLVLQFLGQDTCAFGARLASKIVHRSASGGVSRQLLKWRLHTDQSD